MFILFSAFGTVTRKLPGSAWTQHVNCDIFQLQLPERRADVAFQNFEEVWAALGRLYTDIVRLQESQQQLVEFHTRSISAHAEQMKEVTSALATLAGMMTQLTTLVNSHEQRLARLEGQ